MTKQKGAQTESEREREKREKSMGPLSLKKPVEGHAGWRSVLKPVKPTVGDRKIGSH